MRCVPCHALTGNARPRHPTADWDHRRLLAAVDAPLPWLQRRALRARALVMRFRTARSLISHGICILADGVRFELTIGYPILVFGTSALSHSANRPCELLMVVGARFELARRCRLQHFRCCGFSRSPILPWPARLGSNQHPSPSESDAPPLSYVQIILFSGCEPDHIPSLPLYSGDTGNIDWCTDLQFRAALRDAFYDVYDTATRTYPTPHKVRTTASSTVD